ncbi:hypothetical protein VCRA2113O118_50163 [Vibrio crassostreae]|nr:hypothetical protein THOD03_90012 [Vibrio harveyi]CAK3003899.1 hypothetical protein VCRA2113O118_50163 [Vibrio crassostreae]
MRAMESAWVAKISYFYNWNRAYVRFYFYPVQYSVTLSLYNHYPILFNTISISFCSFMTTQTMLIII